MEKKSGLRGAWIVVDEVAKEARRAEALVIIGKHVRRVVSMWWYGKYGEYISKVNTVSTVSTDGKYGKHGEHGTYGE